MTGGRSSCINRAPAVPNADKGTEDLGTLEKGHAAQQEEKLIFRVMVVFFGRKEMAFSCPY